MSVDHKPGRKAEKRRILRSGGYLDETDPTNPRIVCDSLNVRLGLGAQQWLYVGCGGEAVDAHAIDRSINQLTAVE